MNALSYVGLFAIIIACISVGGLVIAWAMSGPTALDDELSDLDDAEPCEVKSPVWREVCSYCGFERNEKAQCCGGVHFINQPECPECGDHVDRLDGVTGCGLEYQIFKCCHCGFVSEPEYFPSLTKDDQ